jgi:hypothetical protein
MNEAAFTGCRGDKECLDLLEFYVNQIDCDACIRDGREEKCICYKINQLRRIDKIRGLTPRDFPDFCKRFPLPKPAGGG